MTLEPNANTIALTDALQTVASPQVRDLVWAVASPSLLAPPTGWPSNFELPLGADDFGRLLGADPAALQKHLERSETRFLGSYFEALWAFYLTHEPRYEVVAKNLQIRDGGRTFGEFDFIVFDHESGQHLQLELAVKFYLGIREVNDYAYTDGQHLWVGPQARDRLDIKVGRAIEHQLTLHRHEKARQALAELGVNQVAPRLLFRGYLFHPAEKVPVPSYVSSNYGHGSWCRLAEMRQVLNLARPSYIVPKKRWFAAPYVEDLAGADDLDAFEAELTEHVLSENRPHMVVQVDESAASRGIYRYFVTPQAWPWREV